MNSVKEKLILSNIEVENGTLFYIRSLRAQWGETVSFFLCVWYQLKPSSHNQCGAIGLYS